MITPTLHLNGSHAPTLAAAYRAAYDAVRDALRALYAIEPNARDYYPQGDGVYAAAVAEHLDRAARLRAVAEDLCALMEHCTDGAA